MERMRCGLLVTAAAGVVALAITGCSPSVVPASSSTASPAASASASPTLEPVPLTVQKVVAHIGTADPNMQTRFASGHWLYPDDVNNTIVYDGTVVVHGHPVTVALSQNGLHYAYTLGRGLSVYVDGRAVATGTYLPAVFAVSDDGGTVLYSDSNPAGDAGVIYRNGVPVFRAQYGIGQAVGSADAMHYTAVVDGFPLTLVHDGHTVATSGITGMSTPMISPDGTHYGVVSTAQGDGVSMVDGASILPSTETGGPAELTDTGDWAVVAGGNDEPLVDGVVKGPSAYEVVITSDARSVAIATNAGVVLVNGTPVDSVSIQTAWLEIDGTTLYIYNTVA
jgi:hypothetical protein